MARNLTACVMDQIHYQKIRNSSFKFHLILRSSHAGDSLVSCLLVWGDEAEQSVPNMIVVAQS